MKIAHIYAKSAIKNSGDYMIGIATKKHVENFLFKNKKIILWKSFNCRDLFVNKLIKELNEFDAIIVGGGGLILPDSSPNKNSCWQWNIKKNMLMLIKIPIYVISIGFNLFYNQDITMPNKKSNKRFKIRKKIFKEHIEMLINKSKLFTMRHYGDIDKLKQIVDVKYHRKIKFLYCPTIWYVKKFWYPKVNINRNLIAFEVKDDRPFRRYYAINREQFYEELFKFILYLMNKNENVVYLSHDGSRTFYDWLINIKKVKVPFLDNSIADEKAIFNNYKNIKTIVCMAGHSQMMGYGLKCNLISMISHDKLKFFLQDVNYKNKGIEINKEKNNICTKAINIYNLFSNK